MCRLMSRFKSAMSSDSPEGMGQAMTQEPMTPVPTQHVHHQFLGDATAAVPHFTAIDIGNEPLVEGVTQEDLQVFGQLYREHCKVTDLTVYAVDLLENECDKYNFMS